jgi:hypothetical protein
MMDDRTDDCAFGAMMSFADSKIPKTQMNNHGGPHLGAKEVPITRMQEQQKEPKEYRIQAHPRLTGAIVMHWPVKGAKAPRISSG